MAECSFGGCDNKVRAYGLCDGHRRQQLNGKDLSPLREYQRQDPNTPCSFDGCDRPRYARGLCVAHRKQQVRHPGLPLWPLGDAERKRAVSKAAWERKTPEQRLAHSRMMQAKRSATTDEHARRISQALRNRRQVSGPDWVGEARACWGCKGTFTPKVPQHVYCSSECRSLDARVRKYGIDRAEFDRLMAAQGGSCALCGEGQRGFTSGKMLHFDHCHITGKFRGLLCATCNTALGRFGDDPDRLRRAAAYLEAFTARQQ